MTPLPAAAQSIIAAGLGWCESAQLTCRAVQGGDICGAYCLGAQNERVFVKTHNASRVAMFEAEAEALVAMADTRAVRVPSVHALGAHGDTSWLALEWLDFGRAAAHSHATLGAALAHLHRQTSNRFGWHRDNFIGHNRQSNRRHDTWCTFFADERLGVQRDLAAAVKSTRSLASDLTALMRRVPALLGDHAPLPSLLHGDLWGGNWAALADGAPVLFDPASYYGDRETDLAMTQLFGGFDAAFYEAYEAVWPLAEGYARRRDLYQLYHIANHANLFGGGYIERARDLIARLLNASL